jgi:hypothetical protein
MNKSPNIIGQKFNYLTVISSIQKYDDLGRKIGKNWLCICDCGKERIVGTQALIHNVLYSCGCKAYSNITHGNRKYEEIEASFRAKVSTHKAQANFKNIEWDLTYNEAILLLKSNCHYCGRKPNKSYNLYNGRRKFLEHKNKYEILCNGIDRIDSNIGYIKNNVVPCCKICNFAKNDLPYDKFIFWITDLIKYRINENCYH